MIKFNFKNTNKVPKGFFSKKREVSQYLTELKEVLKRRDYDFPESFLALPKEELFSSDYQALIKPGLVECIVLVGIGGSSQGVQALYEALKNKRNLNEILVLDSLNPLFFQKVVERVSWAKKGKTAVFFVSKSGKTLETASNFFAFLKVIKKYEPKIFVVSDENSALWKIGKENNFLTFPIPKKIVGRYSVFSNAGILALSLAGFNIKELLSGAEEANENCLIDDPLKNPALASALTIFYHLKSGKNIYNNLVFPQDLEVFGKWYQQLMAESLGKKNQGMTPTVGVGTSDFHSLGQLYFDGPKDKLINFVFVEDLKKDFKVHLPTEFSQFFPEIAGKGIWQLNSVIFKGVKSAFLKKKIPFTETILTKLDEKSLGFLFQMKMIEIILLAKLMRVNAFNQPGVGLYKKETEKIIKKTNKARSKSAFVA